jgi:hypothetical protein
LARGVLSFAAIQLLLRAISQGRRPGEELKMVLLGEEDAPTAPLISTEAVKAREEVLRAEGDRAMAAYAKAKAKREAAMK